jgi:hypothetical protein
MFRTQRDEVLRALAARGWEVISIDDAPTTWWADTLVTLESEWSPKGARLVIMFLVDPLHDGPRAPREHVWAIAACRGLPKSREETLRLPTLPLRGWRDGLQAFLIKLDELRSQDP